jgi:hypothetical protein
VTGKTLRVRPSEFYKIEDELAAYSFDRAVNTFGQKLEARLQEVSSKAKNKSTADRKVQQEMTKWLFSDSPAQARGRFRSPQI